MPSEFVLKGCVHFQDSLARAVTAPVGRATAVKFRFFFFSHFGLVALVGGHKVSMVQNLS